MRTPPVHRVAWLAAIVVRGLACIGGAAAAEPVPPSVAIVPTAAARAALADLVTADLSNDKGVRLVERQAVNRVVDELQRAPATDVASDVKLGQLLAADAIVLLDAAAAETPPRVRVRVVETRSGIRLADGEWATADLLADRAALLADVRQGLAKLRVPPGERRLVGIVGLRSEEETASTVATARALSVFAERDLQRIPAVVVLEREQLRRLTTERDLTGTELDLQASAVLLEGSLRREGDAFVIALALLPLKEGKRVERTVTAHGKTDAARDAIAAALADMLAATIDPSAAGPTAEAKLLLARAGKLLGLGDQQQASRLAEAAYVLHPCRETFDMANSLSLAALPPDASPVDRAQAGLRQAELIGDFYDRTTESLAWEALFPVELLHSVWTPTPAPVADEERAIRDRIRAVEQATADRVLAFRRAGDRPTTGFVLLRRLAAVDRLVPGAPRPTAADFMQFVSTVQRELATEAMADRLPDGPAAAVSQKGVAISREAFANQYHAALAIALSEQPSRPPLDDLAPLVDGLVGGDDPALRIVGLSCLLGVFDDRGLAAAERILDVYFRSADPPWTTYEVTGFTTVARIAEFAAQRLAMAGRAAGYAEGLVAGVERRGDAAPLMRSPSTFAQLVLSDPARAAALHQRVEALLTPRRQSRDFRFLADRYRQLVGKAFDAQAGKGEFAPVPKPPVGPWEDYVVEPLEFTNAPAALPRLVAAAVDREAGEQGRAVVLLWGAAAAGRRGPGGEAVWRYLLTRCGPAGGTLAEVAAFDLPTMAVTSLAFGDGRTFIGTMGHGLFVIDGRGATAIGEDDGLPATGVGPMAWLDGRLFMAVTRGMATLDPATGGCTVLASAAAVAPRHQLDGGTPYQVTGMIADPVRHRLWMSVAGDRSRGGLWCHSPREGRWRRLLVGDIRGPYWNGGRKALVTRSHYSQALPFEVDLDDGGCTPLLGFIPQDRSHADPMGAGQALFDGLLFTGPGRLLDADGMWYEPDPAGPAWTRIEQVGDLLVACDVDHGLIHRIRRRAASRPPADGRVAGRGDAKLRAAVAALGSDVPQKRLAGLNDYRECRTAIDWLVGDRLTRYLGDEEFSRILLDGSRPAEQMAAIDMIHRLDSLRRFDAEVLRRLTATGAREVAAAAQAQLSRFGTGMSYLVEYPEAETHSGDPLQRVHAVEQIGHQTLVVPKAFPVLVRMLDDPVDFVALAAVAELDPYGDESLPPILNAAARVAGRGDGRLAVRMLAHRLADAADDRSPDDAATLARIQERLAAASKAPDAALAAAAGRALAACATIEKQLATPPRSAP